MRYDLPILKPGVWVGSSLKDLKEFPAFVQDEVGDALRQVQSGEMPVQAKVLTGFGGASVQEIVADYRTDTFRAVYTVGFAEAVYVLHTFQKKSKRGIQTPQRDTELIRSRLKQSQEIHEEYLRRERTNEP